MSGAPEEFRTLMERVLAGDQESARALTEEYGPALIQAVRQRLHFRLRPKFDSCDFVQDVWASFFEDLGPAHAFRRPADLVAFLAGLARNKVVEAYRKRVTGERYNVGREQPLLDSATNFGEDLVAVQPTASTVAMSQEAWDALVNRQPLVYRHILTRVRDGQSAGEIARELRVSARTVRRVVRKLLPGLSS